MKNKQLLDAALVFSIKTVRKNLGGVTLIGAVGHGPWRDMPIPS